MPVSSAVNKKMTNYLRKRAECVLYRISISQKERMNSKNAFAYSNMYTFFISHLILFIDISTSGERLLTKKCENNFQVGLVSSVLARFKQYVSVFNTALSKCLNFIPDKIYPRKTTILRKTHRKCPRFQCAGGIEKWAKNCLRGNLKTFMVCKKLVVIKIAKTQSLCVSTTARGGGGVSRP